MRPLLADGSHRRFVGHWPATRRLQGGARSACFYRIRLNAEERKSFGQIFLHLCSLHDRVKEAVLQQELACLEALGELLANGLFNDARSREPDLCARLCD